MHNHESGEDPSAGQPEERGQGTKPGWGFARAIVFVSLLALVAFALPSVFAQDELGSRSISVGFLFLVPFCLGAIASCLADPRFEKSRGFHVGALPLIISFLTVVLGGVALREGVICIVMLLPLWWALIAFGGFAAHYAGTRVKRTSQLHSSAFIVLAVLASFTPPSLLSTGESFEMRQSIIITAPPEDVWAHLLDLRDIQEDEGQWNIAQDILGIPRPVSAQVRQDGDDLVRYALWQHGISFEERIVTLSPHRLIEWQFEFPNDSIRNQVDRHVDPNGENLAVESGGYELIPGPDGTTELTLWTRYELNSPANTYASLWADFFLSDIQSNILSIVKKRAEGL